METIGFIGLGIMGAPMAGHLLDAGYNVVTSSHRKPPPADLGAFRSALDADLCRRNADYQAHRAEGVGLPLPALVVAEPGGFDAWMRSRGKLGGQHKVPRMDNAGTLTTQLVALLREHGLVARDLAPGP